MFTISLRAKCQEAMLLFYILQKNNHLTKTSILLRIDTLLGKHRNNRIIVGGGVLWAVRARPRNANAEEVFSAGQRDRTMKGLPRRYERE
jgi:hypothetical protein